MMFQVSYPLIPQTQVPSPHLPDPQLTHHLTSLHVANPLVTSPHNVPEVQSTPPHLFLQTQIPSHHLPPPHITSPPHNQTQMTSPVFPQPYTSTPILLPQMQVTSPHSAAQSQISSPHLLSPPHHHVYNQNHDSGWSTTTERSYHLKSEGYLYQDQSTPQQDLLLQNENQFSPGLAHLRDELCNTDRLCNNIHTPFTIGAYEHGDVPGPVQDTWRSLEPTLSQLQCCPQDSISREDTLREWSSVYFSSFTDETSSTQFYPNNAPQPFCSPTTPGPSPHYPSTSTITSPQMHSWEERLDFHPQTCGQPTSCCPPDYDSYHTISDTSQDHPNQTSQHLFLSQCEPIQDHTGTFEETGKSESGFSPHIISQEVSSTVPSPRLPVGPSRRKECRRSEQHGQRDWTWKKQPQPKKNIKDPECRLLCTVCKRDFQSLPALNGHMRSHSGFKSSWVKKSGDPSLLVAQAISTVLPVTVPVQSGGHAHACRSSQKKCSRQFPAARFTTLFHSLLHQEAADGDSCDVTTRDGTSVERFTPPPMLCPVRAGSGLYCSLTSSRKQRAQRAQLHNTCDKLVATETDSPPPGTEIAGLNKPRINIGLGFQAEIPLLREREYARSDSHNAQLLWAAFDELEHPVNQQRVALLLLMAHSSVMPGGGASPESALHVLSECRGDFMLTVEKLLSTCETNDNQAAQHFKRVTWSAAERKLLVKSLQLYHKDFSRIQKAVQTKSRSDCVEFYYLWKKKMNLKKRTSQELTVNLPETNGKKPTKST